MASTPTVIPISFEGVLSLFMLRLGSHYRVCHAIFPIFGGVRDGPGCDKSILRSTICILMLRRISSLLR